MKYALLAATSLGLLLANAPAFAEDDAAEVQALKAEVKALEARIDTLEQRQQAKQNPPPVAAATAAPVAAAPPISAKVQPDTSLSEPVPAQPATVSVGPKGLLVTSADNQYSVNVRGYMQMDDRTFIDGSTSGGTPDTFLIRSARPIIEAKMTDYFDTRFMMDFGRGQTTLLDAYGDLHPMPGDQLLNFRVGETKVPVGLERWESEADVLFVERGQTTNLVPYRDIGLQAYGQIVPGQVEYQLGVMNGAADLQANTGDNGDGKDMVARIFAHPLAWTDANWLQGFGAGVAGTYGSHQGTPTASGLTAGYVTIGQRTYFTYSAGTFADGVQWRFNPQAMYYNGSFGSYAEYVMNDQQVQNGTTVAELHNDAWEAVASYVLTGEDAAFNGVKPAYDFDPRTGHWGAFEIVGRLSQLNVDRRAFPTFASLATSSSSAFEHSVGGTWYFNQAVKLNLDFSYTTFDGGAAAGADHEDEKAVMTRAQVRF